MKTKYTLVLIYENGEGYKIVGFKEGIDHFDWISKKYDMILDANRGAIEVSGDISQMADYIEVDTDYSLTWEEEQKYEPQED